MFVRILSKELKSVFGPKKYKVYQVGVIGLWVQKGSLSAPIL